MCINFLFLGLGTCLGNRFSHASLNITTSNKLGGVEDGPTSLWRCDDIKKMKLTTWESCPKSTLNMTQATWNQCSMQECSELW